MSGMQRPVLSILALSEIHTSRRLLLQRRSKPVDDTPYAGLFELPQGKIAEHETITSFAKFKLWDETGLIVLRYLAGGETYSETSHSSSELYASNPLCCVSDSKQNHLALAVVVLVEGSPHATKDAKDHRWCSRSEVEELISIGAVFPLNVPMLRCLIKRAGEFGID